MLTAVDKVKKGKGRTVNKRLAVMCAHYLFDADFCNVASGWEKGVVEKNVQDSRRRIRIDAAKLRKVFSNALFSSPGTPNPTDPGRNTPPDALESVFECSSGSFGRSQPSREASFQMPSKGYTLPPGRIHRSRKHPSAADSSDPARRAA